MRSQMLIMIIIVTSVYLITSVYLNLGTRLPSINSKKTDLYITPIGNAFNELILCVKNMVYYQETEEGQEKHKNGPKGISIEDYMKYYQYDRKIHFACNNIIPPDTGKITWHKNTYQYFKLKFGDFKENNIYALSCYFDDRFSFESGKRYIRCAITIKGPGHFRDPDVRKWIVKKNESPIYTLLWFADFDNPIGSNCMLTDAAGLVRNVSNTYFYQQFITCIVPEIDLLPTSVSVVQYRCDNNFTWNTKFHVIYPEGPLDKNYRTIGVCMASVYGNYNSSNVAFFVNWMETLNILGVSEITINNGSLFFQDEIIKKAFQHYIDSGLLVFTHYPPIHEKWLSPQEDENVHQSVDKLTTGDCIYRGLKKYWYTLIIDLDEVPVPRHHTTYQELISDYISKYPNLTAAHSLVSRSTFFYQNLQPGNPEYGEHLPLLRLTNRFRIEPMEVDGIGMSKSFHNTRSMVAAGHHLTRRTDRGGEAFLIHEFLSTEDILIHHYRNACKYKDYCKEHWSEIIHDNILQQKFGTQIEQRVENKLNYLGYKLNVESYNVSDMY